jgi:predicted amino acid-binding ACT domain protein
LLASSSLDLAFPMSLAAPAVRSVWSRLRSVPAQYPLAFGVVLSGFKTSFSDLLVQKVIERKEKVDWKRNAAFAAFGFVYLGGVQYYIYVPFFSRLFPGAAAFAAKSIRDKVKDVRGMFNVSAQVFLDQCIHHPLMYFPAFYCTKELVMKEKPDLLRVLQEYKVNFKEDMVALWKVWVPSTLINFAFMPMHLRIPFVAATSLLWTCILSSMRGGDVAHGQDMAMGAVTGATLHYVEEGLDVLLTQPVDLQADRAHLMITAGGLDKPGWVAMLSRAVGEAGGNITHSKMVRLGTDFIITMQLDVEPGQQKNVIKALQKNPELRPLNISCSGLSRRGTGTYQAPVLGVSVRCIGADR